MTQELPIISFYWWSLDQTEWKLPHLLYSLKAYKEHTNFQPSRSSETRKTRKTHFALLFRFFIIISYNIPCHTYVTQYNHWTYNNHLNTMLPGLCAFVVSAIAMPYQSRLLGGVTFRASFLIEKLHCTANPQCSEVGINLKSIWLSANTSGCQPSKASCWHATLRFLTISTGKTIVALTKLST